MTETTDKLDANLLEDQKSHNYAQFYKDVFNAASAPGAAAADVGSKATGDLVKQGVLPGITIGGAEATGLKIHDTNSGGAAEDYFLDPKTGIAKSADGKIQAIFYPNGTAQRFNYDGNTLTEVVDANGGKHSVDGKNFQLDENGTITIKNKDGSVEEHKPDGSAVYKDDQGAVTNVIYAFDKEGKRTARDFELDPATHQPTKVTVYDPDFQGTGADPAKSTWVKGADGTWTGTMADGSQVKSDAKFSVDQYGNSVIENKDGSKEVYLTNGESILCLTDGTTVQRNKDHQPTQIKYPDGKSAEMKYDDRGRPAQLTDKYGNVYTCKDGKWSGKDENQKPMDFAGIVTNSDGSITFKNTDGTSAVQKSDGTTVAYGKDGKATEVFDASGKSSEEFVYESGVLKSFKLADGKKYTSDGKGGWTDQDHNTIKGSASVDNFGNVVFKDDNGTTTYSNTDGSKFALNTAYGTGIQTDAKGHVTRVVYPDGAAGTAHRDNTGTVTSIDVPEGKWSKSPDGNTWTFVDSNGIEQINAASSVGFDDFGTLVIKYSNGGEKRIKVTDRAKT